MKKEILEICINNKATISDALKQMDFVKRKLLIVVNKDNSFYSVLSIGDIQRAIIKNIPLNMNISHILRTEISVATINDNIEIVKNKMKKRRNELMPILDNNEIEDVIFWEDIFDNQNDKPITKIDSPVVIMAGGRGTRLRPLTNVLPKPLIPIKDKTFIEEIFDSFNRQGCNDFYISVNFKSDLIEYYLNKQNLAYNLFFFKEDKPLGTAGSLSLLKDKIKETFFVSNCDIIIEQDYSEILDYHKKSKNEITLVAALKHFPLAYGTIESGKNGRLLSIIEKPELNFKINSGMYILEPHLLSEIPENTFFHITDLINKLLIENRIVGVFPVSEKSWVDVGNWKEYLSIINK